MDKNALKTLLNSMTIEEKIGQTVQITAAFFEDSTLLTGPLNNIGIDNNQKYLVGSVLGVEGMDRIKAIQDAYLEKSRLKIPLLFMADVIHGDRTIFPIPLGLGATWNPVAVEKMATVSAREAAVQGLHITFSPMVDLVRDARWGRVLESTGEDSYLNSIFTRSFVKGYQGKDLKNNFERVGSTLKHFIGYGASEAGRDYNNVTESEIVLREKYLPAFQAGIEEGAKLVMTSFNPITGIPASANKYWMNDVLRKELNFDGPLISDWGAIGELISHRIAEDKVHAGQLALEATVDIDMMSGAYSSDLVPLIKSNPELREKLDDAVMRILQLKSDLNLFKYPYRGGNEEKEEEILLSESHRNIALEITEQSFVLLKNNNQALPLLEDDKVLLTGPLADSNDILGAWAATGRKEEADTLLQSFQKNDYEYFGYLPYELFFHGMNSHLIHKAKDADKLIVALGESSESSGEAASQTNIKLPIHQIELVKKLHELGKSIIVVIYNGRPLDLSDIEQYVDAILVAWFPGTMGSQALFNTLTGQANPSGRLSMSFPRSVGQLPISYDISGTGRPYDKSQSDEKYITKYIDSDLTPAYPFGFGLSYTTFLYSDLKLSRKKINMNESLTASIKITNTGDVSGKETVQLYIQDLVAETVRPDKQLINFKQIELQARESCWVDFEVTEKDLRYVHSDLETKSDPGKFLLGIGSDSTVNLIETFELTK